MLTIFYNTVQTIFCNTVQTMLDLKFYNIRIFTRDYTGNLKFCNIICNYTIFLPILIALNLHTA